MAKIKIIGEIEGFNRILYESTAKWEGFSLSVVTDGIAQFEISIDNIDTAEQIPSATRLAQDQIERFILSVEWDLGCELKYKINDIDVSEIISNEDLNLIRERLNILDSITAEIFPAPIPTPIEIPQIPLEAKRWIQIWVESRKLNDYVEEQLRRHYLIIEELWQENNQIFNPSINSDKKSIKLIRDFVSHESCNNREVVALIEKDLPSALFILNKIKHVRFNRTNEHRNYISRFELKAREIARALVNEKLKQLGAASNT